MFCTNCGNMIEEQMSVCPFCGKWLNKNIDNVNSGNNVNQINNMYYKNMNTGNMPNNIYGQNMNTGNMPNNMYSQNVYTTNMQNNGYNQNMSAVYNSRNMQNINTSSKNYEKMTGFYAFRCWLVAITGLLIGFLVLVGGSAIAGTLLMMAGVMFCPLIQNKFPDNARFIVRIIAIFLMCLAGSTL